PTVSDTLAAVLKTDLDLTPIDAQVRSVIERCLRKDVRTRWQAIGDVRIALEESAPAAAAPIPAAPVRRSPILWIAAAVLAITAPAAGAGWWSATRSVSHPLVRLSAELGPDALTSPTSTVTISPDGSRLVFLAQGPSGPQLATRRLDEAKSSVIPGTESGVDPFFSPDGEWIGFFAGGKLKKVASRGGGLVTLCDAPSPRGGSWGDDGNIVVTLTTTSGLVRIPNAGGATTILTKPEESRESTHRW